jgi:chemoreceptor-like protein with four helix bundle sensory module
MFNPKLSGDRRKPVVFFFLLLTSVILLEYSTQRYYKDLDRQMSSLYRDRLLPSNYILKLNDQLHKKQRWHDAGRATAGTYSQSQVVDVRALSGYNDSISNLISLYQKTYLTNDEQKLWLAFNSELNEYNLAEHKFVAGNGSLLTESVMSRKFDDAIKTLSALSELQTQEGYKLQTRSRSLINGNLLQHMLELSLLFVMGILAIHWLRNEYSMLPKVSMTPMTPSAN